LFAVKGKIPMTILQDNTDLAVWQAEILRVTCFPSSTANFDSTSWWKDITGEQPEKTIERAREGFRQDEGVVGDKKIVLGVQPARIDWLMQSVENENQAPIGAFTDNLDSFLTMVSHWFKIAPPLARIAFGSVLMFPVDTREAGYELLAKYLPKIQIDSVGTSDFLYQINRPRMSQLEVPELKINRFTKWAVQKRGLAQLEFLPTNARISIFPSHETFSCRLELDINTSADFKSDLPQDKLMDIFNELVELAKEITVQGDIA
jgi:hypothetical protein